MRPGTPLAGGIAASALILIGAFVAFEATRPPAPPRPPEAGSGPPLRVKVVPPHSVHRPAAPSFTPPPLTLAPPAAPAPAARPPLSPAPAPPGALSQTVPPSPPVPRTPGTIPGTIPGTNRATNRATNGETNPPRLEGVPPRPAGAGPRPATARVVAAADAFWVRLEPSPLTPRGFAYADTLRAALARQGAAAARPGGRVIWSVDRAFVARLGDGSEVAVVGGYGVTELAFRELTPGICRLLFGAAEDARAYLAFPGAMLRPAGVAPAHGWAEPAPVMEPRALCARLGPAFDAWRRAAPSARPDLADLDRGYVSISSPRDTSAPGRRS